MATQKWLSVLTSRATVLATELNALASAAYSGASGSGTGAILDNTGNLDTDCSFDVTLASYNPTGGGITILLLKSIDGTTYEDPPSSTNPGFHMPQVTLPATTGASAKRVQSDPIKIGPFKYKAVMLNGSGTALGATLNTVVAYTGNLSVA